MPKLSERSQQMPQSPIRKLVPYAEEAHRQGKTVYYLNIGQPDIETPQTALDAIHTFDAKVIEYSHSAGFESYRRKLAGYYQKHQLPVEFQDIIITTGGSEALIFAFSVCFNPGDEVIIPEPFYANYNGFATSMGVKVKPVTSYIENGFALPPIEDFEKLITPKTKGIMICNPGNPTGYLYSKEELEVLREIVKKHDLFLFADEVYREFCYEGKAHHSVLTMEGIEENVVVIDSVSKRYSMCGARIGALVSKNKALMSAALKYGQARLSPPTIDQIAAEAAIGTPDSYFEAVITEYQKRRDVLVNGINQIEGVFCPKPGGAFYAVASLPIDDSDKFCQWLLSDFHHNNDTVMLAPAKGFYATSGLGMNEVRIAYVLNEISLRKAIECLQYALAEYPNKVENPVLAKVH